MLLALPLTEPALAHVDVRPRVVEQGKVTQLRIELPQLRAGAPPDRLLVEGDGITVLATSMLGVAGAETRWSVRLRVSPIVPPGELLLVLRAFFADGESVEVDSAVVVVPPAEQPAEPGTFPWPAVVGGVTLALVAAAAVLIVSRRRNA
ncbi:MAG TPA: hypothetical protein VFV62_03985 [Gaiellaceae bacterium]|nr:hypothetical protein [Gaiellaceae bacterium]